ncbi:hypothetical protein SKAU_G00165120 [Synaphobranchus kaupii]|uniref:Uncharacterized protein n=1 Tax=Synaphobranchus kaupii TaxID=118154 RepID=A0A9Q1J097_SYNKA|nr:hypothetical protein SKAU_G00165120 [Synaphobranchus kaupii]
MSLGSPYEHGANARAHPQHLQLPDTLGFLKRHSYAGERQEASFVPTHPKYGASNWNVSAEPAQPGPRRLESFLRTWRIESYLNNNEAPLGESTDYLDQYEAVDKPSSYMSSRLRSSIIFTSTIRRSSLRPTATRTTPRPLCPSTRLPPHHFTPPCSGSPTSQMDSQDEAG